MNFCPHFFQLGNNTILLTNSFPLINTSYLGTTVAVQCTNGTVFIPIGFNLSYICTASGNWQSNSIATCQIPIGNISLAPADMSDVRYLSTADHYWSGISFGLASCASGITSQCVLNDNGTSNSAVGKGYRSAYSIAAFSAILISGAGASNVTIGSDNVFANWMLFNASVPSCLHTSLNGVPTAGFHGCLVNPSLCLFGLSAASWVLFDANALQSATPTTILSVGGSGYPGFWLYQSLGKLYVNIYTSNTMYSATGLCSSVMADYWVNVGFIWSSSTGANIVVDGLDCTISQSSQTLAGTALFAQSLYIGCNGLLNGFSSGSIHIAETAVWYYRLRTLELPFLGGGLTLKVVRLQTTTTTPKPTLPSNIHSGVYDYSQVVPLAFPTASIAGGNTIYAMADIYLSLDSLSNCTFAFGSAIVTIPNTMLSAMSFSSVSCYCRV